MNGGALFGIYALGPPGGTKGFAFVGMNGGAELESKLLGSGKLAGSGKLLK